MAQAPPSGIGGPPALPPVDASSLTDSGIHVDDSWVKAPPPALKPYGWTSNGAYGRVQTKLCYADGREIKQEERKKYLQDKLQAYQSNPSSMTPQEAIADRSELGSIYQAQNPGEASLSSGPTQAETDYTNEQAAAQQESMEHLEDLEDDPFWFVPEAAGKVFHLTPHQVAVLHKQSEAFGEGMSKLGDAKEAYERAGEPGGLSQTPGAPFIQP